MEGEAAQDLFDALQRKASAEIETAINNSVSDSTVANRLRALSQLNGGAEVLAVASQQLAGAPAAVAQAIAALQQAAEQISARMPEVNLYFDLSELRGYHYHTGLVFAALAPGHGQAVANGGRYDDIGEVFGRARPATGFNTDLKALLNYMPAAASQEEDGIFAPDAGDLSAQESLSLWKAVQALRADGERVVAGLSGQVATADCRRQLILQQGQWTVESI